MNVRRRRNICDEDVDALEHSVRNAFYEAQMVE